MRMPLLTFSRYLRKIPEHHTELETHRYHRYLNFIRSCQSSWTSLITNQPVKLFEISSTTLNVAISTIPRIRPNNKFRLWASTGIVKNFLAVQFGNNTKRARIDVNYLNLQSKDLYRIFLGHDLISATFFYWSVPAEDISYDMMIDILQSIIEWVRIWFTLTDGLSLLIHQLFLCILRRKSIGNG